MVKFLLQISAELENLTDLQPQDGCNDPDFSYLFKLKCGWCGELSPRETCVSLNVTVPLPFCKRTDNVIQKCKLCERYGMIMMHPGSGKPLTQAASKAKQFAPLMIFDCSGYEPVDFEFVGGWRAKSHIDLSSGEFVEYDVTGKYPVMISNLQAAFVVGS